MSLRRLLLTVSVLGAALAGASRVAASRYPSIWVVGAEEAAATVAAGRADLLDVRTSIEQRGGIVPDAVPASLWDPAASLAPVRDSQRPVYVICAHGARSREAVWRLREQGLLAFAVGGGIARWRRLGLPWSDGGGTGDEIAGVGA